MKTVPALLLPILSFLLGLPGGGDTLPAAPPVGTATAPRSAAPAILTPEHGDLIRWALERYEDAGLDLDGIAVGVFDDQTVCGEGRRGFYVDRTVTVCAVHERASTREAWRRHALLHELGHAWMDLHLDPVARARFMEARGVETWTGRDVPWEERGAEHAAETMTWAIDDTPAFPDVRLEDRTCDGLRSGYALLTGTPVPHGFEDHCS